MLPCRKAEEKGTMGMPETPGERSGNPPERLSNPTFWLAVVIVALVLVSAIVLAILSAIYPSKIDTLYLGAILFGGIIGWVTYRSLRREGEGASISDIASVISAVGGTTVTGLWSNYADKPNAFSWYLIGLFLGFFIFYLVSLFVGNGRTELLMGKEEDTKG